MNNLEQAIKKLKEPFEQAIDRLKVEELTTLPREFSFKHPDCNTGVHLRDDNTLELYAGNARILLNGNSGAVAIVGDHLYSSTGDSFQATEGTNSFSINGGTLNFDWLPGPLPEITRSPVTFLNSTIPEMMVLTGSPTSPKPVPLSTFFASKPLFRPTKQKQFMDEMVKILEGF